MTQPFCPKPKPPRRWPDGLLLLLAVLAFCSVGALLDQLGEAQHWRKLATNCSPIAQMEMQP